MIDWFLGMKCLEPNCWVWLTVGFATHAGTLTGKSSLSSVFYIYRNYLKTTLSAIFCIFRQTIYFFISCRKYSAMTPGGMSKDLAGFKMPGLKETQTKS